MKSPIADPSSSRHLPEILKRFQRLKNRGKPLYVEAYKIIAATTEVIKMKSGGQPANFSPTSYFACLQEMLQQQLAANAGGIEALLYAYSAIVSMLDSGVVANQEQKIVQAATYVIQSGKHSPSAVKYSIMCLQFVLSTKSAAQWQNPSDSSSPILSLIFSQTLSTHKLEF